MDDFKAFQKYVASDTTRDDNLMETKFVEFLKIHKKRTPLFDAMYEMSPKYLCTCFVLIGNPHPFLFHVGW